VVAVIDMFRRVDVAAVIHEMHAVESYKAPYLQASDPR
jgi:hypothetical protein